MDDLTYSWILWTVMSVTTCVYLVNLVIFALFYLV